MSWAEEDWTVGLSGRVLQKVKELQIHHERLSRENKQKQLQLDNIHASLEKQTVKYEEVRVELQLVQRELQSVRDEATIAVTSRDRLTQELQTKQAQVCSLEGQLDAARTLNNKLTQEIKRLEAELEKLQNSVRSPDTSLFSTPCWNTASPWEHSGSRQEEKQGHRDEGQSRTPHIRQRLQFSETPTPSLPQQQHKSTRHSHSPVQSDTFSTPLGVFPWERDDTKPAARRRPPPSPSLTPCSNVTNQGLSEQGVYGKDCRTETDMSPEIQSRMSSMEEELLVKDRTLKSIQNEMTQTKKELAAKELSLQRASTELSLAQTRLAQDSERAAGAEQRLKQLQEELKCQRQNAESSRLQHQQRTKELEKQHQRDLTELQKERQCVEKQHQQEVNKLNQELQQARTLHNALQAQADKLSLQKQVLEKELETLKEKLKWTEGQLKESLRKETQTQAKLTEAVREAEGVAVSLEQSRKRERVLEEEGRRLADERADTLCLLKELQEQKSAPPPQSVQFCPIEQSFSSQSSSSHYPRPPAQTKRPSSNRAEQRREEEDAEERRTDIRASYPADREPGEGIDSEHISALISPDSSECLKRAVDKGKINEEENKAINEAIECDVSRTPINNSNAKDLDRIISLEHSPQTQNVILSEQTVPSEDLKKENAMLRSQLQDVREELQKRLEDLEAQRRAETEARTRLKQLSRKHTSHASEKEEKEKEWKAQLETERAETERLRRAMTALEADIKSVKERGSKKARDEQEEEKNKELQDRESEMIELNIQLKKQLAEVKAQLALEREEKKREEEERSQIIDNNADVREQLSMKVVELKAQMEELKQKGKPTQEEKHTDANTPLTYLTLRDDELNSNIVSCGNTVLPSPEQHLLFCQSTNQHNMLVSQTAADIIQEKSNVKDTNHSPLSDDVQIGRIASDPQKAEPTASDLVKEVERLKNENAKETERTNQCQIKLEALQSQVTRQTQQLTMAFEKQSQHIAGLLAELQEKESALQSQKQELLQCKQELDELKSDKKEEVKMMVEEVEEEIQSEEQGDENSELPLKQEKESKVTCQTAESLSESDLKSQCDASQPETCDTQTATPVSSEEANKTGEHHPESIDSNKTKQSNPDSACVMVETQCGQNGEEADILTELLTLRQENQLLKQRIEGLTISDTQNPTLQTDGENQDDPTQNTPNAALSCLAEDATLSLLNDVMTEGLELNMKENEDEGQLLKKEDERNTRAEEDLEEMSELHVTQLQQQVEALQIRVRALSEETQQQAEELVVWRLASQTAPTFEECETHELTSAVTQSQTNQVQTDGTTQCSPQNLPVQDPVQTPTLDRQKSQETITVIREDELLLSCSSNKLQGRMLFSRLQKSNFTEPKSLHPFNTAAMLQEYSQDPAKADQESEKENQEINFSQCSHNCPKVRRDTQLIQMTSEKMAQHHSGKVSEPDSTQTEAKLKTTTNSSDRVVKIEMKSVSSQTEESLNPRGVSTVCVNTQTEEEEEQGLVDSPPVSPVHLSGEAASGDKILFSGSFPIPADPARLAERIRRNRTQLSAAFDDTEYEPYGLPEVVMKGFADIPNGPACPYIVRRGLLGTAVVPVSQKDTEKEETD